MSQWDARQVAMLEAMGLRVFAPTLAAPAVAPDEPAPARPPAVAVSAAARSIAAPRPPAASHTERPELATLDWAGLQAAAATCSACPLSAQRRHVVFGAGSVTPQWLVVTEPPDETADASGEPLPGPSGKLLDNMLAAAGLRRDQVYVTPVVKCRPPRGRAAEEAEVAACAGILARQVELLGPRVLLAMGRQAGQALTGRTEPIGKLRGQAHRALDRPVVATYDPGYLLRNGADKAAAWDDLCLVHEVLG